MKDTAQEMPVVTITKDGTTTLNGKEVNINDLGRSFASVSPNAKGVYVRADRETIWDIVAQVTAELGRRTSGEHGDAAGGTRQKAESNDIARRHFGPAGTSVGIVLELDRAASSIAAAVLGVTWVQPPTPRFGAISTAAAWGRWRSTWWRAFRSHPSGPENPVANDTQSRCPPRPRPRPQPKARQGPNRTPSPAQAATRRAQADAGSLPAEQVRPAAAGPAQPGV